MFIKICGITRREDAEAAVAEGASALGFVFWPGSPRFIDPSLAKDIVATLPRRVAAVGLFVNQPASHVNSVASHVGLSAVQLHGDEDEGAAAEITLPVIKAVSLRDGAFPDRQWPGRVMLLIDADDPVRRGGTGMTANWPAAAVVARRRRVLLAGGLRPDNVAEAIKYVRPFGIDVSSGVEQSPGIKDRRLLEALFEAIREAEADAASKTRGMQPRKHENTATKARKHEKEKPRKRETTATKTREMQPRTHENTKRAATKPRKHRHESTKTRKHEQIVTKARKHGHAKKAATKRRKRKNTK
jgi:phosphoribosylanthranilate isomerase